MLFRSARVLGVPDAHEIDRLRRGIVIDGRRTLPAGVTLKRVLKGDRGPEALVEMVIKEGRNRQVRMMCDAIGHPVVQLVRTRIGALTAAGLKPGHVRSVSPEEIRSLMRPAAASPTRREALRPKTAPGATRPPRGARPARPRAK